MWFAPAGHLVAWDQVVLRRTRRGRHRRAIEPSGTSPDALVSPRLNLWRAATDNDGFKLMPKRIRSRAPDFALKRWQAAGLDRLPPDELVGHQMSADGDDHGTTYRHVVDVPAALDDLPRVGVWFTLPPRFDHLRWHGRGPHENYPDRNRSAMVGIWSGPPDESPYLVPQEFGLRTDCRWFEAIDSESGEIVRVDVLEPQVMHVSATRHTADDLFSAATAIELHRREGLIVCLDVAHRGVGTGSCGPDTLEQYRVGASRYEFAYRVRLLD
jgi:beta-galactosidase